MWLFQAWSRKAADSPPVHPEKPLRARDILLGDEKQRPRERLASTVRHQHGVDSMRPRTKIGTITICHSAVPPRLSSKNGVIISQVMRNLRADCDIDLQLAEAYRNECQRLLAQNAELEGERQQLKTRLGSQVHANLEMTREREQLEHELDDLKAEFISSSMDERKLLDDSGVRGKWTGLVNAVYQIVAERYRAPSRDPREAAPEQDVFGDLVPDPERWLRDPELREWLFQAIIWQWLSEVVFGEYGFSANSYNLSGDHRAVYSNYLQALRDECAKPGGITRLQYQKLKAALNMILSPKKGIDQDRIAKLAEKIEVELSPFQRQPPAGPDGCFSHTFEDLISDAVELDVEMAQCRAWYQVSMGEGQTKEGGGGEERRRSRAPGLDFDAETMENAVDRRTTIGTVSLIVTPLLVKWGDIDGNSFDTRKVLARRQVVCWENL